MVASQRDYRKPCQTHTNEATAMMTTNKKANFILFFPVSSLNVMHTDPTLSFPGDLENIKCELIKGTDIIADLSGKAFT